MTRRWQPLATVTLLSTTAVFGFDIHFRHTAVIALRSGPGDEQPIEAACVAHGYRAYQDRLRCRLIDSDGTIVGQATAAPGSSLTLPRPRSASGRMALEMNSGWNLAVPRMPDEEPWAIRCGVGQPLKTVREWGPLYFAVPSATRYFNIWIHASVTGEAARLVIRDPEGTVVHDQEDDFDARTKCQLRVPPELAGRAWSITLAPCTRAGFHTDDVHLELGRHLPPFLAPTAAAVLHWAGDWRYAPEAPAPPRRLQAREPLRPPFAPTNRNALDWAYERRGGPGWRTSLPLTYVLDYGPDHVNNPDYVARIGSAPPALLHLGKDVPLNHAWGPIRALGGENQAYGHGEHITRLSPAEVENRLRDLRTMVAALHGTGVRLVTPYICGMTINGDIDKRTGFWEFYDHWDAYRGLGLAARPPTDPKEWLQTTPDGKPQIYYRYDPEKEYYPPFKTNHRFAACWHTQGWRTWLLQVVRFVAACDCDGVFVDNATSQRSTSAAALRAFRGFLADRYDPEQAAELLGIDSLRQLTWQDSEDNPLLKAEMQRFWARTIHQQMQAIKTAGTDTLKREFVVFPNGGRPAYIQAALRDTDFIMFEKSHGEYGTHPGLVLSPILEGITLRTVNDNLFEYLFVRSLRQRVRPVILSRPGYPRPLPHLRLNPEAAQLGMAECAAFSGGGAFLLRPRFDVYHDTLNLYREFFENNAGLYAGLLPYGDTALLAFPEQSWLGNPQHLATVRRLTSTLAAEHVLFELLAEQRFGAAALSGKRAVGAVDLTALSDARLRDLVDFAVGGGLLVASANLGATDEKLRPREHLPPPLDGLTTLQSGERRQIGGGWLLRADTDTDALAGLTSARLRLTQDQDRPAENVRAAAYVAPNNSRLVIHAVNYHVPLGTEPPPVEAVQNLAIDLALPPGTHLTGMRTLSPEEPTPLPIELTERHGRVLIRLPRLRIYAVTELLIEKNETAP